MADTSGQHRPPLPRARFDDGNQTAVVAVLTQTLIAMSAEVDTAPAGLHLKVPGLGDIARITLTEAFQSGGDSISYTILPSWGTFNRLLLYGWVGDEDKESIKACRDAINSEPQGLVATVDLTSLTVSYAWPDGPWRSAVEYMLWLYRQHLEPAMQRACRRFVEAYLHEHGQVSSDGPDDDGPVMPICEGVSLQRSVEMSDLTWDWFGLSIKINTVRDGDDDEDCDERDEESHRLHFKRHRKNGSLCFEWTRWFSHGEVEHDYDPCESWDEIFWNALTRISLLAARPTRAPRSLRCSCEVEIIADKDDLAAFGTRQDGDKTMLASVPATMAAMIKRGSLPIRGCQFDAESGSLIFELDQEEEVFHLVNWLELQLDHPFFEVRTPAWDLGWCMDGNLSCEKSITIHTPSSPRLRLLVDQFGLTVGDRFTLHCQTCADGYTSHYTTLNYHFRIIACNGVEGPDVVGPGIGG
jgi:hypothetical protein